MNVDVFGRRLGKVENSRGLPGIGYKLTQEGHFDVEHKKISNLADASTSNDAVNLKTLINYVKLTDQSLRELIKRLRSDIDDLSIILKTYKSEIDSETQKKINDLTDLVEEHRDNIDKKLLETNNSLQELNQGLEAIYLVRDKP